MRIVRTRRGARLVEGDVVLSEIRSTPGPTHTLFDVLAACVAALAPGPRCAVLGFAGGGMIAPLRAMGFLHTVEAVDLDASGEGIFRELSGEWAGDVEVTQADAERWLRRRRGPFDLIVEDLSVPSAVGTVKPYETFDTLPALIARRLRPKGVVVTNLLPLPGTSWDAIIARIAMPHEKTLVVHLDEYENRLVLAGDDLPTAKKASTRVRAALRAIASNQAHKMSLRTHAIAPS